MPKFFIFFSKIYISTTMGKFLLEIMVFEGFWKVLKQKIFLEFFKIWEIFFIKILLFFPKNENCPKPVPKKKLEGLTQLKKKKKKKTFGDFFLVH